MSELKQYHNQTVYTGGLNCPYLRTSVVLASDAEAALKEKDARIKELEDALRMIKANSYYCNSCSASMYAEEALEQFDEVKQEARG